MTAFLIDEMFPTATAVLLRDTYGHDAAHVAEVGLRAAEDAHVASVAQGEGRAVVTENVADFAAQRDVLLLFVLQKNLPPWRQPGCRARQDSRPVVGLSSTPSPTSALIGP